MLRASAVAVYLGADAPGATADTAPVEPAQTGADLGSTASTAKAPAPATGGARHARDMDERTYAAAKAQLIGGW
jgi:hypothetical protein